MDAITIEARGLRFPAWSSGKGPLVLCLHGFPDCLRSFRHQLPALASQGYRVVAPALRGYAPSCAGSLDDAHALEAARDAVALVHALGETRAFLVGHDWGAAVSYLAAALSPRTWWSLTTLSVPHPLGLWAALANHPGQLARSSYMAAFQARGLAEHALRASDFALIDALWRRWSPGYALPDDERAALKSTLAAPGVLARALAYYRVLPRFRGPIMREARALLARPIAPPVLGVVGRDDTCIASDAFLAAMAPERFQALELREIPDAGHFVHQEAPRVINDALVAWFVRTGPGGQDPTP